MRRKNRGHHAAALGSILMAVSLTGCSLAGRVSLTEQIARKIEQIAQSIGALQADEPKELITLTEAEMAEEDAVMEMYCAMPLQMSASGSAGYEQAPLPWNTEEYKYLPENGWHSPLTAPFSTFAADVDTASYANVRRMILRGETIPADAVRIEEMINYFDYDYPDPGENEVFSVTTQIAPCPWNDDTSLLMIGMKTEKLAQEQRPASNLVFLIDVSGSMDEPDKLPLVQRAFRLLTENLTQADTVSVVTYASEERIALDGAAGDDKVTICEAIEDLFASGGTNGSEGLRTAYALAKEHFIEGGNNRVILATDGDLNLGITDEGSLIRFIEEQAESGVALSVLGFGTGNISDTNMEALADHGNGNYSYIDSAAEARKVLVSEAGGTLCTVAKDVKLQVEFNPDNVKGYRLVGYEDRLMDAEDFADDTKDGGEIGAGHCVTVLYEIAAPGSAQEIPVPETKYGREDRLPAEPDKSESGEETAAADLSSEWATLHIRYKNPDEDTGIQSDYIIGEKDIRNDMTDAFAWAAGVAQAGMLLKGSEYAGSGSFSDIRERLRPLAGDDAFREEFLYLLGRLG